MLVITGGTKGIGRAIIEKFASQGMDIATCARKKADLNTLKKEIEKKYKVKVHTKVADLSKRKAVNEFIAFVNDLNQPIDILVNNTGFFAPGQIQNEEEGVLEKTIETNLYSAYHITRGFLPSMMRVQKGHIFMICSTASIMAYTNGGSYCISKFGMLGMSKVLREELKPHKIRVTSVLPGATLTASWEGVNLPTERFMKSEDVAEMVFSAYKVSERSVVEEILMRPMLGDIV